MAVVYQQNQENEEEKQQDQAPQVTNPGSSMAPSGQSAGQAASAPGKPTSSGRFTNLTGYLNANKNFNQGQGLAGKINQNISNQGNEITKNVANAVTNFNDKTGQQVGQAQQAQQATSQVMANPVAVDPNLANQVSSFINTQYTGPKSLGDLEGKQNQASLQSQASNFTNTTNQGQTEAGRYNILRTMFNKPSYTTGQQNLDNLLIQGNKDQLKTLQDSRKLSGQLNQNLNTSINQTSQAGNEAKNLYNTSVEGAINSLSSGVTQKDQELARIAQEAQAERDSKVSSLRDMIANSSISQPILDQLGLSAGQSLYNIDPNSFVNVSNLRANAQNVGTADDYARISALGNILGQKSSPELSALLESYKQNSPEELQRTAAYSVDRDRLRQALSSAESGYKNDYASIVTPGVQVGPAGSATNLINGTRVSSTGDPYQDLAAINSEIQNPTFLPSQQTRDSYARAKQVLESIINRYTPNRKVSLNNSIIPNNSGETQ